MLALLKTLAGVTGFEPAKTGFGDQRPSHRVLTPVAVATGVEPVPPDRQSGILHPAAHYTNITARRGPRPAARLCDRVQFWLRGHDSNVHEPGQSR